MVMSVTGHLAVICSVSSTLHCFIVSVTHVMGMGNRNNQTSRYFSL